MQLDAGLAIGGEAAFLVFTGWQVFRRSEAAPGKRVILGIVRVSSIFG